MLTSATLAAMKLSLSTLAVSGAQHAALHSSSHASGGACRLQAGGRAGGKLRLVRTLVVDPKPIGEDRHAIGEVKPRYESDLSFRVAGKVLSRLVDVGASVTQGDTLATLDTQDYQNRLRSAEADVSSAEAALVEAQGAEARQAKLLKDGWTPKATYDAALRNLRAAEARLNCCQGQSRTSPATSSSTPSSRPISTA